METLLKILHLEDLAADAEIVERVLRKANFHFEKRVVSDKPDFVRALREFRPDIILLDHSLPAFNSLEALRITREEGVVAPFILVTATVSEEYAVNVIKEGAGDYILKDRLERLPNAVQNALDKSNMEKARMLADEALRSSEQKYKLLFESNPMPMWMFSIKTLAIIDVNDAAMVHYGYSREEFLSLKAVNIWNEQMREAYRSGIWKHKKKDGHLIDVEVIASILVKSHKNVSSAMEEIRQLTQTLVAPSLGGIGLDKALCQLIENLPPSTSLELSLDTSEYKRDIADESMKLTCYRIVQVQLNNIIKHARAKKASIRLKRSRSLELVIQDDGIGFNPEKRTPGIGLRNIRNRVGFYNGEVSIFSEPGSGCTLTISIPL